MPRASSTSKTHQLWVDTEALAQDPPSPCIVVFDGDKTRRCWHVKIHGPSEVVYGKSGPMGRKIWVETQARITVSMEKKQSEQ